MRENSLSKKIRYEFSDAEKLRIAELIDGELQMIDLAESELAEQKLKYKRIIETAWGNMRRYSGLFHDGFEMRDVKCKVLWNQPSAGEKTTVRLDTGEQVAVEPMSAEERQEELPLEIAGIKSTVEISPSLAEKMPGLANALQREGFHVEEVAK